MRVLLVAPPHVDTFGYSMPPPGLLRLGGELHRHGFDVELEDLAYRLGAGELFAGEALALESTQRLLAREPAVLGLSVMGATLPIALCIAERARAARPKLRIVLGGPGTTGIEQQLLERCTFLDAIVRGEGERSLVELLRRWSVDLESGLEGIAGTSWRRADGAVRREAERAPLADLGELAPYAWDLLPSIAQYKAISGESDGLVPIDSGRGCVFDCSFCTIGRFWGRRSRTVPVERLACEIEALRRMPGARQAYLCHDIFGADRKHALELCQRLVRGGCGVPFEVRARADHLDQELVEWLGRAGCYRVLLGIESGDAALRNAHGKHMDPNTDLLALVERLGRAGITPILSCILGLPGESEAQLEATLALAHAAALRTGVQLSFHLVNPQPGCALGEEQGARSRPVEGLEPDMARGTGATRAERAWIEAHPDLFSTYALLSESSAGSVRLFELARIQSELSALLMRYPRTIALLARRAGHTTLAWFRAFEQAGRSLEATALATRDTLVGDALHWEQALLRAASSDTVELLEARHDLALLARELCSLPGCPQLAPRAGHYALRRTPRGVRTLRVSQDLARVLASLRQGGAAAQTLRREAHFAPALEELARAGLLDAPTALATNARHT